MAKEEMAQNVIKKMFTSAGTGVKKAVDWLGSPMMETAQDMSKKRIGLGEALKHRYNKPKEGQVTYHSVDKKFYKLENNDYVFNTEAQKLVEADASDFEFQYGKALGDAIKTGTLASGAYGAVKGVVTNDNEKFDLPGIPFI